MHHAAMANKKDMMFALARLGCDWRARADGIDGATASFVLCGQHGKTTRQQVRFAGWACREQLAGWAGWVWESSWTGVLWVCCVARRPGALASRASPSDSQTPPACPCFNAPACLTDLLSALLPLPAWPACRSCWMPS